MRNVLAVLGVSIFLALSAPICGEAQSSSETYRQLDLFGEVFNRVRADYVDEVDDVHLGFFLLIIGVPPRAFDLAFVESLEQYRGKLIERIELVGRQVVGSWRG